MPDSNNAANTSRIYFSYAWKDKKDEGPGREEIVNKLYDSLKKENYDVIRDKVDLGYTGLISDFMKEIGRGNFIVVVISNKYLHSPNCMFELLQIYRKSNSEISDMREKIFPIILEDATIYDPENRTNYIQFWVDETNKIKADISKLGIENTSTTGLIGDYKTYQDITANVDTLISLVKDMNTLSPEKLSEDNFEEIKKAIIKRSAANAINTQVLILQSCTNDKINVIANGIPQQIDKTLDALKGLIQSVNAISIQTASDNIIYNPDSITNTNFGILTGRVGDNKALPDSVSANMVAGGNSWIQSLRQELINKQKLSVGNSPSDVFQNYSWLIQSFLLKIIGPQGQKKDLRSFSFMVETYQATLRYLCYVQMAQVLQMDKKPASDFISGFVQMQYNGYLDYDYTNLLVNTTDLLGDSGFMKEIKGFVAEINNTDSSLYGTAIYLDDQRDKLRQNKIGENDLPALYDEYLTALVFWLRKVSFMAQYRLVSIKEINLDYRLGTAKYFVHTYGDLHGAYDQTDSSGDAGDLPRQDYISKSIEGSFTFSKSILLIKGSNVDSCMDKIYDTTAYISMSPLLIDQSVYNDKPTQTPEIFYYTGYEKAKRKYNYAEYKNELPFGGNDQINSNKFLGVFEQNNSQFGLDTLFLELDEVFKPFKTK